jgi:hypothetical protein
MRFEFNCGMAGKGHNGENPMWLGRCWGYWLPRWQWNGGRLSRGECCDMTILWLCFWVGVTVWNTGSHRPSGPEASEGSGS